MIMGIMDAINDEINSYRNQDIVQRENEEEKQKKQNNPLNTLVRTGFDMVMQMQTSRETSMMVNANGNDNMKYEHSLDEITSKRAQASKVKGQASKVDPEYVRKTAEDMSSNIQDEANDGYDYEM